MNEQPVQPQQQTPPSQDARPQTEFYRPAGQDSSSPTPAYAGYNLTTAAKAPQPAPTGGADAVVWEASEYIHHDKGALWIACLAAAAAILVAIAVWLQIWTFAVLIIVMAITMGIFAFRPPKVLHYTLNTHGLSVDNRSYDFADFRAFGILSEGAFYTIMLIPARRFMPAINVFFAEQDGEKIVDILGGQLPMEELHIDFIDRLMRRLRF